MKLLSKLVVLVAVFFCLLEKKVEATEVNVESQANVAIEMDSGKILYSKNSDTKLAIASVSKIVTMYMVLDKLNSDNGSWDDVVPIDDYLISLSNDFSLGSVPLSGSHSYTVRDLFYAMCLVSSNSATMALGDWVAPDHSQSTYIAMANEFLRDTGLSGFTFVSASGLENSDISGYIADGTSLDDYNKLSAKDVSMVARRLISDYPEILEFSSTPSYTMSDGQVLSCGFNVMNGNKNYDPTLNIDGLKTGFTYIAGFCFVGTEFNGEFRTISVVLNSSNYGEETNQLMHYARENYTVKELRVGENFDSTVKVKHGKVNEVGIELSSPIKMIVKRSESKLVLKGEETILQAPFEKGRELILGTIADEKDDLGYLSNVERLKVKVKTNSSVKVKLCYFPHSLKYSPIRL